MFPRVSSLIVTFTVLLFLQPASAKEDAYVEGEVLVTFRAGVAEAAARTALGKRSMAWAERYEAIARHGGRQLGLVRRGAKTTAELIAELKQDPAVETVEPNYIRQLYATPNDADFSQLWGLRNTGQTVNGSAGTSGVDIQFLPAWRLARPSSGEVVVAVADTGIDPAHPDLAANLWTNPGEIAGNGLDDDANGYIDDVHGYDFAGNTATLTDPGDHGTHVCGTIAAVGNNSSGVVGVNFNARILPLKVSADGDTISTSAEIAAFNYAVALKQKGVNIVAINASFGGSSSSSSELAAVRALNTAGIVLCAAAGNEAANNNTTASYPANYAVANVISVAAIGPNNQLADFSNYGSTTVDLAAPGVDIYSTIPTDTVTATSSVVVGGITYPAAPIEYSGVTESSAGLAGTVYACGIGNPAQFPAGVSGNIALIQRGTLTFAEKITNAMAAGAVAAIVYDNTGGSLTADGWTLGAAGAWIPAVRVTQASGTAILAQLPATGTVANWQDASQAYEFLSGTSMACPHVAGAVAFAALNFPAETMSQRIARILNHTTAVASLAGKTVTGGRLDLLKMVDTDSDGLPDWWESNNLGTLAAAAAGDDDHDGSSNRQEFLYGTSPGSSASAFVVSAAGADSSGENFSLSFPTIANRTYQVEWSETMLADSWAPLGEPVAGTGSVVQIMDEAGFTSAVQRFYRVKVSNE